MKSAARRATASTKDALARVPGPSSNPATNLLILDVALLGASMMASRAMERALLRLRYPDRKASDILEGEGMVKSMAATSAARMATRSVPGFLLVTGGLLAKSIVDRSLSRRESSRRGERQIAKQAAQAEED